MLKIFGLRSNWEIVAFYFIEPFVNETQRRFYRQQIMRPVEDIIPLLRILGHKRNPTHPEETLQKTLQNMRDKNWINFLGGGYQGEYELTNDGYAVLLELKKNLKIIRDLREEIKALRK